MTTSREHAHRRASAEQLAIAMTAMARRLFEMGGTIGEDEHGFRNMGDQLAGWAGDVRELGVRQFTEKQQWRQDWLATQAKLTRVVQLCRDNTGLHLATEILEALND